MLVVGSLITVLGAMRGEIKTAGTRTPRRSNAEGDGSKRAHPAGLHYLACERLWGLDMIVDATVFVVDDDKEGVSPAGTLAQCVIDLGDESLAFVDGKIGMLTARIGAFASSSS